MKLKPPLCLLQGNLQCRYLPSALVASSKRFDREESPDVL